MNEHYRYPKPDILKNLDAYHHAVIEASAGTGKTYTIEHLVVDLLLHDDLVPLEKILVVTFTRRSTWDLRHRIRKILEKILNPEPEDLLLPDPDQPTWDMDPERRRIIQDALHKFDIAPIYTIHGFCQRVLKQHAFEQNRLFDGAHVHDHTLFAESFRHILRTHLATHPDLQPWLKAWLHLGSSVQDLMDELLTTHRSRMPLVPEFDDAELEALLQEAREHVVHHKSDDQLKDRLKTAVLHRFAPIVSAELRRRKAEQGSFSYDDMLDLVWDTLKHPERGPLLARALRDQYRFAIVDEFQDTDPVQWSIFKTLFLQSQGRCTLYIIGDPKQAIYGFRGADVQTYLRARQEVADAEGRILHLTGNFRSTPHLIDAYNRIFDQRAPKPLFTGNIRYDHPVACGKPRLRLEDERHESDHPIHILSVVPEGASLNAESVRNATAEAIAADIQRILTPGSRLLLHDGDAPPRFIQPRDIFILTRTGTELRAIGDTLRRWGLPFTLFKEGGLYATPEAQDILDVLRAVADPFSVSSRYRAYLTPFFGLRVEELERWDQVEHDVAGPRTVRQLIFAWHQMARRGQLQRLFSAMLEQSGVLRRAILLDPSERAQTNTVHILEALSDLVNHTSLDVHDVIVRLAAWIDGRDVPEGEDGDTQRMEGEQDAVQLMTIHKSKGLEAAVVYLFGGLGRFYGGRVTYIDPQRDERVTCFSRKLLDKDTRKLAEAYDDQEAQRLMYVAVTRAKARLVLPWIGKDERGKRLLKRLDGDWRVLNARLDAILDEPDLLHERGFLLRTIHPPALADDAATPADKPSWGGALDRFKLPDYLDLRPEPERHFNDLRQRRLTVTSYSALKAAANPELPPPVLRSEIELDLTADDPELSNLPRGRDFGVIVHHLLELLPLHAARDATTLDAWTQHPEVAPVFTDTVRRMGLAPEHLDYCQRICFNTLRAPLPPLPSLAFAHADSREVEFTFPIPQPDHPLLGIARGQRLRVERGYIVGVIDLIFSHDDRIYFADWKTDLLERYDPEPLQHHVHAHYDLQARLYALAMARLLRINTAQGWERFGGYLYLFVRAITPDKPGHGVFFHRPSWDDLLDLEAQLQQRFNP